MIELVPSIIAYNLEELNRKLSLLEPVSPWAHLDVVDGRFANTATWQEPADLEAVDGRIKLEVHLMIESPEDTLAEWRAVADRIIIHAESTSQWQEVAEGFSGHPNQLGVALKLETPVTWLDPILSQLKFVHLMSIDEIGYHGRLFDEKVLEKIKDLRAKKSDLIISVDGGINKDNLKSLIAAGANHLIVGAAIWDAADPAQAFTKLNDSFN